MSRSTKVFILCVVAVAHAALVGDLLRPQLLSAQTASPQLSADPRAACAADVQKLCSNVPHRRGTNHRLPQAAPRGSLGPLQAGHRRARCSDREEALVLPLVPRQGRSSSPIPALR